MRHGDRILALVAAVAAAVSVAGLLGGAHGHEFTLGYISGNRKPDGATDVSLPGTRISGAVGLAVDDVNAEGILPRGHKLRLVVGETYGDESTSVLRTAELWRSGVDAFVGPQETCVHEARLAHSLNLPMVSHFCSHQETSDKSLFGTFSRTRPPATFVSKSVASLLLRFGWTHVAFFHPNVTGSEYVAVAEAVAKTFKAHGIHISHHRQWSTSYSHGWREPNFFKHWIAETKSDVRIYFVLGESDYHLGLLEAMFEEGLFHSDADHVSSGDDHDDDEYFVVGIRADAWEAKDSSKYLRGDLTKGDQTPTEGVLQGMRHYLGIMLSPPRESSSWSYSEFTRRVRRHMRNADSPFANLLSEVNVRILQLRREAAYLYDAVRIYAFALAETLNGVTADADRQEEADVEAGKNGTLLMTHIVNRTYFSAMGYRVFMDANGDAEGNYTLVALSTHSDHYGGGDGLALALTNASAANSNRTNNKGDILGLYPVGTFVLNGISDLPTLELHRNITWPRDRVPRAVPKCGFRGELCADSEYADREIAMGVVGGVGVVLAVVMVVAYRNYRYEQELDSLLWRVDPRELKMDTLSAKHSATSAHSRAAAARLSAAGINRSSQVSIGSVQDPDQRFSTIYTPIGVYRGRLYAVKRCPRMTIDINRKLKKELKALRDLRHDNLNSFVGACVEPGNVCILSEYCTRGSLRDILSNEDVKLDNMFVASLVGDVVRGMIYLHESPIRFHANLKAANCLVDSRWVLKISDFGLHEFRFVRSSSVEELLQRPGELDEAECRELLYRAPELLRCRDLGRLLSRRSSSSTSPASASAATSSASQIAFAMQKADVYSFAIILFELHAAGRINRLLAPFGESEMSAREVLERVVAATAQPAFRPRVEALEGAACADIVKACLRDCWAERVEDRIDFKTVRGRLRPLRKGLRANIFDNMIAMMETYANNLESLVDERTQMLIEEKRKTEALLYEMLPRTVAEQLKQGRQVNAESFDCVTIYFSDIVGFTLLCSESTPLQVVDFLNDLYTLFDSTIENFDVYKVETIGDAYMVVSGLPVRNADRHAGEIASMSVTLLEEVRRFRVRHRPQDTLMLRAGIHSGPVCAGVVGRKMPRFCLFGDTVNTASRMESSGLPLRVHCSQACRDVLVKLGGFRLEERGPIHIKGKGTHNTFWLQGEEPGARTARQHEREALRIRARLGSMPQKTALDLIRGDSQIQRRGSARRRISRLMTPDSPGKVLRFSNGPGNLDSASLGGKPTSESAFFPAQKEKENCEILVEAVDERGNDLNVPQVRVTPSGKRNSCPCIDEAAAASISAASKSVAFSSTALGIGTICHASLSSLLQQIEGANANSASPASLNAATTVAVKRPFASSGVDGDGFWPRSRSRSWKGRSSRSGGCSGARSSFRLSRLVTRSEAESDANSEDARHLLRQ